MSNVPLFITVSACLALGQFLFKRAGLAIHGRPGLQGLLTLAALPSFYIALTFYGVATVLWIYVLSRASLTQAYPWIMASGVAVPVLGWYFYGERVSPIFWVGIVTIAIGLFLTQVGSKN